MSKWQMRLWAINHFPSAACDFSSQLTVDFGTGQKTGQMHRKVRWSTSGKAVASAKSEWAAMSTWDIKSESEPALLNRQTVCDFCKENLPKTKSNLEVAGDSATETLKWTHLLRQLQGLDQKCSVSLCGGNTVVQKQRSFQEKGEMKVKPAEMGWDSERH